MKYENLLAEARASEKEFTDVRRYIHAHAEVGFSLPYTAGIVFAKLSELGYAPKKCGRSGITATVGEGKGKCILLRADMDALPLREETGLPFAARGGNMHACGHDMHTAMLLLAAKLLKAHEHELCGTVKLMFQPAEELLAGAKDMLEAGVLEEPHADADIMLHVLTGVPAPVGTVILPEGGVSAPAADYFEIKVHGRACHGAMPENGADALISAAHILAALSEIPARELGAGERAVLTVGKMAAGEVPNAIAGEAHMAGSLRAYSGETREKLKKRLAEISRAVASAFRTEAEVSFGKGTPALVNDGALCRELAEYCRELLPRERVRTSAVGGGGSEDFAYIAEKVPAAILTLSAGAGEYPLHHPKVCFEEGVLPTGGALYAHSAMRWLCEHAR
ncbi:MAG: amidohydrolase [Clostridia bacterium]|nr:amidohydrolase [Clostridia bacterium]